MNHRQLGFLCVPLIVFVLASPVGSQPERVAETVKQLRAIPVSEEPGFDLPYNVPAAVRPLLTQLKHQLRELLTETLNTHPAASAGRVRQEALNRLAGYGVHLEARAEHKCIEELPPFIYGGIWDISFHKPEGQTHLLAAVTTIEIGCGDDSSFYVFERRRGIWELVLARESNGYEEVHDAQGHFDFQISPPDEDGKWFLVTTSITPWCTSNWRGLRYQVLRPGPSAYEPKTLFNAYEGIYIGVDEPLRLRVNTAGFSVDHVNWFDLDDALHSRVHVRRFQLHGDRVTRVLPLALAPHDFLDEWKRLHWEEASKWVVATEAAALRSIHETLGANNSPYRGFGIVQPCAKSAPKVWAVSLGEKKTLFFTIQQQGDEYRILAVADQQPTDCPGSTPPQARTKLP